MIRPAGPSDLPACMNMARTLAEVRYPHIPFDERTAWDTMQSILHSKDGIFLVGGDGPDGMIGGRVVPCHFNRKYRLAGAAFWWAEPGLRSGLLGIALARAFIEEARRLGANEVQLNRENGKTWPVKAIPAIKGETAYHIR